MSREPIANNNAPPPPPHQQTPNMHKASAAAACHGDPPHKRVEMTPVERVFWCRARHGRAEVARAGPQTSAKHHPSPTHLAASTVQHQRVHALRGRRGCAVRRPCQDLAHSDAAIRAGRVRGAALCSRRGEWATRGALQMYTARRVPPLRGRGHARRHCPQCAHLHIQRRDGAAPQPGMPRPHSAEGAPRGGAAGGGCGGCGGYPSEQQAQLASPRAAAAKARSQLTAWRPAPAASGAILNNNVQDRRQQAHRLLVVIHWRLAESLSVPLHSVA